MTYALYLDDERSPTTDRPWVIVRTFDEFTQTITDRGLPDHISFDHDLGADVPTGHDCAKWLIDLCLDNGWSLKDVSFNVHSANTPGRERIQGLLDNWLEKGDPG